MLERSLTSQIWLYRRDHLDNTVEIGKIDIEAKFKSLLNAQNCFNIVEIYYFLLLKLKHIVASLSACFWREQSITDCIIYVPFLVIPEEVSFRIFRVLNLRFVTLQFLINPARNTFGSHSSSTKYQRQIWKSFFWRRQKLGCLLFYGRLFLRRNKNFC